MQVYTAQASYRGADRLDITVRSKGFAQLVAPTWPWVNIWKATGDMQAYLEHYLPKLLRNLEEFKAKLLEVGDEVTLICVCPPDRFCHRLVVALELAKDNRFTYCGERTQQVSAELLKEIQTTCRDIASTLVFLA